MRSDIQNKALDPILWNRSCTEIYSAKRLLAADQWSMSTSKIFSWKVSHQDQLQTHILKNQSKNQSAQMVEEKKKIRGKTKKKGLEKIRKENQGQ